ncbi:MAG: UDP-N-acetylmuramate--L-alanine ligase [Patescibacteria group bacterium]|jgi:UDP-N-acetylmuramate--alanine ligase
MSLFEGVKKVHMVGAGGIGVSAAAKLLAHEGKIVTGSDLGRNEAVGELEAAGIRVSLGHAAENLPADADLLVYSSAVSAANPERAEAARRGIRQLSYFEFLGEYSRTKWTIAVSGTNGKSTTTAILGLILEAAGLDPTVIVGSKVRSFPDQNLRLGRGKYFVVEACEHQAHMLELVPRMIVLTNIEEDHLDYYRDLEHIRATFQKYVGSLPTDGALILNADDPVSCDGLQPPVAPRTYGFAGAADYRAADTRVGGGRQSFVVSGPGGGLGRFELPLPGSFNIMNALAAIAAASELGVPDEIIRRSLAGFPGLWRRFEKAGERGGAPIYSDYGHHPTAVAGTVQAAHEFHSDRRVVLCFQPHQHSRTKKLFEEFVASFDGADVLVLAEIFDVAGREESADSDVSSAKLVEAVLRRDAVNGRVRPVFHAADPAAAKRILIELLRPADVCLVMGAGDIYKIAAELADPRL